MREILDLFDYGHFAILEITDWLEERRLKQRFRSALGREVNGVEVTSLKLWMEMPRNEKRPPKSYD
jgi:hypothetical protein